jgi:hypothetical protein
LLGVDGTHRDVPGEDSQIRSNHGFSAEYEASLEITPVLDLDKSDEKPMKSM